MSVPDPRSITVSAADVRIRITLDRHVTVSASGVAPVRVERKQAALLAYLHHVGSAPRGRLADLLWPSATASGARSNLRQCFSRLRRVAAGVLAEDGDTVALAPDVVVEAPEEERAELLDAYDYSDCDDFARWLHARIDGRRSDRRLVLAAAVRAALDSGDFDEAQDRAEAMHALDPESEDPYRALMEVAYRRGDYAAGVRAWNRCRRLLLQQYGVTPSTSTQVLAAAILAAAPAGATTFDAVKPVLAAGRRSAGNLGIHSPILYGRETELATLLSTMREHRLVTLIGIGGIGKTSLALAAAHAERARSVDVSLVELAPLNAAEGLASAVAQALGLHLPAQRPSVDELVVALRPSAMLLVLDNAEHLTGAVSALAGALLSGTAHLRLLVTSRQALRLAGEQRFRLSGLSTPANEPVADSRKFGAVALFEARAAALDSRFRLTAGNAQAVGELCRHLDGVPLAIELAAARVSMLGVEELRNRLRQSLRILGSSATNGAPRHQTLRATFDWTHALLTAQEQTLLRRLAVFVGGFTLQLAEQVACPDAGPPDEQADPLDVLGGLIDKSLVVTTEADPPRYRMLEVTRAYALQKLVEADELDKLSRSHAHAIWRLFAAAEHDLNEKIRAASSRGEFLARVAPELNNLRSARAWCAGREEDRALRVGLAAASTEALRLLGLAAEALNVMLELRDAVDASIPAESAELFWTGLCALGTHGRLSGPEMLSVIDRAESLYRRIGSARRIHVGLYRKGFALLHLGAFDAAQRSVGDMEALEGRPWPARAVALRLNLQGCIDAALGRFDASIQAFRKAQSLVAHEVGETDVTLNILGNLCMSLVGAERYAEALAVAGDVLSGESSPVVRNLAHRAAFVALTFLGRLDEATAVSAEAMSGWRDDDMLSHMLSVFAWLAYLCGRTADAFRLDGAARAQVVHKGFSPMPAFDRARTNLERATTGGMSTGDVSRWRREGEQLPQVEVVALCVGAHPGPDGVTVD